MQTALYSKRIAGAGDMAELEAVVARVIGGGGAGFMRSREYVRFRLAALYGVSDRPVEAYGDTLRMTLDGDGNATVFLLGPTVDPELPLGKRPAPDSDEEGSDDDQPCPASTQPPLTCQPPLPCP